AGVHTVGLRVTVGLLLRTGSTAHVSVIDAEKSCVAVTVMAYVAVSPGATVCGEPETVRLKSPGDTVPAPATAFVNTMSAIRSSICAARALNRPTRPEMAAKP